MKVKELRTLLGNYSDNAKIMVTWEGIFRDIKRSNLYSSPDGVVIIDADRNLYKEEIISGEKLPC